MQSRLAASVASGLTLMSALGVPVAVAHRRGHPHRPTAPPCKADRTRALFVIARKGTKREHASRSPQQKLSSVAFFLDGFEPTMCHFDCAHEKAPSAQHGTFPVPRREPVTAGDEPPPITKVIADLRLSS
jgi:hypothetical protein